MRRFLGTFCLLSVAYLLAAALSSWLFLNLLDLTYEAFAAWLLVPVAQALAVATTAYAEERRSQYPRNRLTPPPPPARAGAPRRGGR